MNAKGSVFKYGDNVDTDVIIPARHLNTQTPRSWPATAWRTSTRRLSRVKDGDIMVGGENFGCGSSREHAPVAIKAAGIAASSPKLCPHLLPQRHQHRSAHPGVPRRQ